MGGIAEELEKFGALNHVTIPDVWQQQAVSALRAGQDVVVHAPTGAGKTLIFELWSNQGKNRGQAIYTVPTRALANDKLAEWRARGWNVGIATGDLSENLDAPVIVATLETQKNRLIRGDGPTLLVIDEYQMLGDDDPELVEDIYRALHGGKIRVAAHHNGDAHRWWSPLVGNGQVRSGRPGEIQRPTRFRGGAVPDRRGERPPDEPARGPPRR